jgi:hypothetical protein
MGYLDADLNRIQSGDPGESFRGIHKSAGHADFWCWPDTSKTSGSRRVAEGVGFEPTVRKAYNGFRDRPIRPLWHPSEALYSGAIEWARVLDCDLGCRGRFVWVGGHGGEGRDGDRRPECPQFRRRQKRA